MTIDANTGAFSWTPTESQGGTTPSVTIIVTDNGTGTLSDAETFTITVNDTNTAPVLNLIGAQSIDEGATLSFSATTTDSDVPNDTLTYSLDAASIALGMSIDANSGAFSWTPTESQGGTTPSVTITVTDNGTGTLSNAETFTVTVNDTNTAPVLNLISAQSIDENTTPAFTASASDSDLPADTLTYSVSGGADRNAFAIDAVTGVLRFVSAPNYEFKDTYDVQISVTDSGGLAGVQTLTVSVNDVNESPVIVDAQFDVAVGFQGTIGQLFATDPDSGDVMVFQLITEGTTQALNPFELSEVGVLSANAPEAGDYQFEVKVIDAAGLEASAGLTVSVASVELGAVNAEPDAEVVDFTMGESTETDTLISHSPPYLGSSTSVVEWSATREAQLDKVSILQIDGEQSLINETASSATSVVVPASEFSANEARVDQVPDAGSPSTLRSHAIIEMLIEILVSDQRDLANSFTSIFGGSILPLSFSIELISQLDLIRSDVESKEAEEALRQTITTSVGTVVTATLSVGFATWLLQSGLFVASAISTTPLWRSMDPMPILIAGTDVNDDDDADPTLGMDTSKTSGKLGGRARGDH